ncbi:hypothetical protein Sste5346_007065 [Sporothrix stenoceras]|uniref:BHLH domain-containing protein n=1 Tax=Sporothrix stenoceras TaxID=5173 RepID=A0ABR3YWQ1_9PEZI
MDVCQPISSLPSSSAFTFPMKMQLQNRQQQQQQIQRQQKQKLQQQQQLQLQLQQQQQQQQQAQDTFSCSPDSLYGYSLDEYTNFTNNSYGTDFSADSPLSLGSPVSPTTANPFAFSAATDDFDAWNKIESPDADEFSFIKPEPGNSPLLFATTFPSLGRDLSVSPAINPLQLSNNTVADDFGLPAQKQQPKQEEDEEEQQEASVSPSDSTSDSAMKNITMPARDRRYAVRKSSSTSRNSNSATASSSLKRKSSSAASSQSRSPRSPTSTATTQQKQTTAGQPPKKTAHNLIEKRYRTNLNDKILALRDSVPSLRVVARRSNSTGGSEDEDNDNMLTSFAPEAGADGEDLGGLTPAHKLNKATILSKATEYIAHLERRNEALARENTNLRGKVDGYEMLVMSRGGQNGVWC